MAVSVSAGGFRWLLLPIWPQPHRPSDYFAILSGVAAPSDSFRDILMEARRDSLPPQMTPEPDKQSAWDRPLVDADKEEVRRGASGLVEHARLDAVCRPHSADWMMALPLAACGLVLDNEA